MVITSPFCSASKNFHQNDDKFAIKHSMQPMQCCMEGSIIIHHGIQNFFVKKYGFKEQKKRARMQIQGKNTQIHKVRPSASSVSHWDEQDSITIIIMNSNQKHDMISLSFVLMNNRVEEEKIWWLWQTDKIEIGILHKNTKISRYKISKHTNVIKCKSFIHWYLLVFTVHRF